MNTENNSNNNINNDDNNNNDYRNKYYLNKYQQFYSHNNEENINLKNKIMLRGDLMPYANKMKNHNKLLQKKVLFNLLDSSNISNLKKSIRAGESI